VDAVQREQAGKENLRVLVYPCASLQLPEESSFEVQHNGADAELQQPHLARL
jgi:hypothetical protein